MRDVGSRVELTEDTLLLKKGHQGTIIRMFTPHWSTGCWNFTVQFDNVFWTTGFPFHETCLKEIDD